MSVMEHACDVTREWCDTSVAWVSVVWHGWVLRNAQYHTQIQLDTHFFLTPLRVVFSSSR